MITTINEYTRNPQYLKSLFKKIYRGINKIVSSEPDYKKHTKLEYKIGTDNNNNNVDYTDVISGNYTYLNFEIGYISEKYRERVKQFLDDYKKELEDKSIVMSYYESCYDAGYDIMTMKHSGKIEIQCYYKIYVKDAMGKRIKPPKYVYHSSPVSNREKIKKEGIKVSYPKNWKQEGMYIDYMPSIFAVKGKDGWHGEGDIWEIDTTKIDNKWWEDLNLYKSVNWSENAIMTFENIPPHAIKETMVEEEKIEESMITKFEDYNKEYVKSLIRDVSDFPKEGITFKDIQMVLQDPQAVRYIVDDIYENIKDDDIEVVLGLDARGFILGPMIAQKLGVGFAMARKKGKLPPPYVQTDYELEYGNNIITVSPEIIRDKMKVHIHDDLLATGGTLQATVQLIKQLGSKVVSISNIIELDYLNGRNKLKDEKIYSFLRL